MTIHGAIVGTDANVPGYLVVLTCPTDGQTLKPINSAITPDHRAGVATAKCPECSATWQITVRVQPARLNPIDRPVRRSSVLEPNRGIYA